MSDESSNTAAFDCWCLIELFGHNKIVGHCTQQVIAGTSMLRVDVPTKDGEGVLFTRYFHGNAIYGISPISKAIAVEMAAHMDKAPVQPYDVPELSEKLRASFVPRIQDADFETEETPPPAPTSYDPNEPNF